MNFRLLTVLVAAVLAVAVSSDAFARAGKSGSMGSRGSRTYDRPIERSVTPPPATQPGLAQPGLAQPGVAAPGAAQPMYNPNAVRQPTMAAPAPMAPQPQPGFFQRNPVMGGIMGGLIGAGIGSMLFGHSPAMAAASQAAPMASMLGTLLQIALIGGLVWLGFRLFRRRSEPQPYPQQTAYHREAPTQIPASAPAQRRIEKEFDVSGDDQDAFSRIITGVQQAWADGNPVALRQLATPEVVGWMSEDLQRDQANGVRNVVEDVQLLKGDVTETWHENGLDYATAVITFSSRDYMVRIDNGAVVEGDPRNPVEATEAWTFVRGADRAWRLSAIEQV